MADIKTLQTRIALKYDTWANWNDEAKGAGLVLLKGEIGLCEIPSGNAQATTAPTVLFKVGDGTTPFKSLKWASALAADVYGWAKSETVVLDGEVLKFKTGDVVNGSVDLSAFATDKVVEDLEARVAAVEGKFSGDTSVEGQIAALDDRLDAIEGENGAIANALIEAKDYTDAREDAIEIAYKAYTDGEVDKLEAKDGELSDLISGNTDAIGDEAEAREAADKAINDKIGEGFDSTNTVKKAIEAAKKAGDDAQAAVDALTAEGGAVANNTAAIAEIKDDLADEVEAREALDDRLVEVEAFFKTTEGKTIDQALDTLVEIQDYLNGEGSATGGLIGRVAANEGAIDALEKTLAKDGDFEKRVAAVESTASANSGSIEALQRITSGYTEAGAIKTAIEAAQETADTAKDNAKTAQDEIDALELVVNNEKTGLAAALKIAEDAAAAASELGTRVDTAEDDIDALQAIVSTGDNRNEKLREDLTALSNTISDSTTGLAATKKVADDAAKAADDNAATISKIQEDYLKAADLFIIDCGTSTTVIHNV